ncbi:MAG: hypothetical protein CEE38_12925 [Planctomycetes bacterium B3_Pla]|nr:MAG: hypothetical protein CEE38_12925 [Planctomycetes bacterium B3_Pla]
MTVSEKQLKANKKNARKAGVKTPEGKAIVKYNALKHGLLAKEVVITVGEGAEDPEEFNALLVDLKAQLAPAGTLEEMLVEKVAVAYWRLRRAYRYEVGLIRKELDTAADDFYGEEDWQHKKVNEADDEIDREIAEHKEGIEYWKKDKRELTKMYKAGKPLEEIYDWEENWECLYEDICHLLPDDDDSEQLMAPKGIREFLNTKEGWSDARIWTKLIGLCDDNAKPHKKEIARLEKQKQKNKLRLQVIKKLGNIPSRHELDRLLRYEGAIERQLYKAVNQLERLQRLRAGDNVPPPVEVDLDVNTGHNA